LGEPEGLDVGRGPVDRHDAAVAGHPADDGQSNISRLPSQWIRRPSVGVSHAR
jgi:hypothetical protein